MRNILVGLLFIGLSASASATTSDVYHFSTTRQKAQFERLIGNLRCLVCQNQSLAESDAKLAKDLRDQVYYMVESERSDGVIISYLTKRYGQFVLFKPRLNSTTVALWFGPFAMLFLGLLIWGTIAYRRRLIMENQ